MSEAPTEDERRKFAAEWLPVDIRVTRQGDDYELEVRMERGAGAGMFHLRLPITDREAGELEDLWHL